MLSCCKGFAKGVAETHDIATVAVMDRLPHTVAHPPQKLIDLMAESLRLKLLHVQQEALPVTTCRKSKASLGQTKTGCRCKWLLSTKLWPHNRGKT